MVVSLVDDPDAVDAPGDNILVTSSAPRRHGPDYLVGLHNAGLANIGFTVLSPTLNDVFLAGTGEDYEVQGMAAEDDGVAPRLEAVLDFALSSELSPEHREFEAAMPERKALGATDDRYREHFSRTTTSSG